MLAVSRLCSLGRRLELGDYDTLTQTLEAPCQSGNFCQMTQPINGRKSKTFFKRKFRDVKAFFSNKKDEQRWQHSLSTRVSCVRLRLLQVGWNFLLLYSAPKGFPQELRFHLLPKTKFDLLCFSSCAQLVYMIRKFVFSAGEINILRIKNYWKSLKVLFFVKNKPVFALKSPTLNWNWHVLNMRKTFFFLRIFRSQSVYYT